MEALIKKLQEEVDITEDQAIKALTVIKGELEKGNFDIDWNKLLKLKYGEAVGKTKEALDEVSTEAQKLADKLADKADVLADSAREKLRDISLKAADFFDDKKD